jgi:hypothetical protein
LKGCSRWGPSVATCLHVTVTRKDIWTHIRKAKSGDVGAETIVIQHLHRSEYLCFTVMFGQTVQPEQQICRGKVHKITSQKCVTSMER